MGVSVIAGKCLSDSLVCAAVIYSVCVLDELPAYIFSSFQTLQEIVKVYGGEEELNEMFIHSW